MNLLEIKKKNLEIEKKLNDEFIEDKKIIKIVIFGIRSSGKGKC
jgi:hypothetical protein